tara:strand:+ start:994 stop:1410 length:417 start_codon:yes stop_codon:yes gene_type:complete
MIMFDYKRELLMIKNVLSLAILVLLMACATSGPGSSRASRSGPITVDGIAEISAGDAYDVVEKLRAGWLRSRGPNSVSDPSPAYPTIYVDGTRRGEMDMLRTISVMDIQEIDFLSTQEANLRYGQGHFGGIIHVTTKR